MIDYKKDGTYVTIINKINKEIIASGKIVARKDIPELLISFDFKHFFSVKENPLYLIEPECDKIVSFDADKYKDEIRPYVGVKKRKDDNELIFLEHDITELDPPIAPLVYTLNDAGYKTTGSCCGHGRWVAWVHIIFEDFDMLKNLITIIERDEFKNDFILSTNNNIINVPEKEIRMSLQTTIKGKKAYKSILELSDYIKHKKNHRKRLKELQL